MEKPTLIKMNYLVEQLYARSDGAASGRFVYEENLGEDTIDLACMCGFINIYYGQSGSAPQGQERFFVLTSEGKAYVRAAIEAGVLSNRNQAGDSANQ